MARTSEGETAWPAPAKINRFLHIVGRRDDGYHLLQTVFQFLDYGDTVHLRVTGDGDIRRAADPVGVAAEADLTLRAAHALQRASGTSLGAVLRVTKRLPAGGGLGGGSSDAATVLVALNHLWGCGLGEDALAELGLALGADVPVFVRGRSAWAEGVGERLQPLELDCPWYVVLAPECTVSTAELFQAPELTRNSPPITIRDFCAGGGVNAFEPVARARYSAVDRALRALTADGKPRMSGSGGCVFLPRAGRNEAEQTLHRCQAEGWQGFVARGVNRSPLHQRMAEADG